MSASGCYPMPQPGQLSGVILVDFLPLSSFGFGVSPEVQLVASWAVMPTNMAPSNALGSFIEVRLRLNACYLQARVD